MAHILSSGKNVGEEVESELSGENVVSEVKDTGNSFKKELIDMMNSLKNL